MANEQRQAFSIATAEACRAIVTDAMRLQAAQAQLASRSFAAQMIWPVSAAFTIGVVFGVCAATLLLHS